MKNQSERESQLPTTSFAGFLGGEIQHTYGYRAHEGHSHDDEIKTEPHPTPKSDCCGPDIPHPTPKSDCCECEPHPTTKSDCCPDERHPTTKSDCCEPHPHKHQHAPQHASWFSL